MKCPSDEGLSRFHTGNIGEAEGLETLSHLSRCRTCRDRYESLRESFRERMNREAVDQGYVPRDRERLEARILSAVESDRKTPTRVRGRPTRPYRMWVPLAAAAALLMAVLGVRILGDMRWKGRSDESQGAQLLVARDGGSLRTIRAENNEVGPGDLLLTLPDSSAGVALPDGARVKMTSATLIGLGTREGAPEVFLAKGAVSVTSPDDRSLRVNVAGTILEIHGTADLVVEPSSPVAARKWLSAAIAETDMAGIFPAAFADTQPYQPVFRVHSTSGEVVQPSGRILKAGLAAVMDARRGAPYRLGKKSVLLPAKGEILTAGEMAVVRVLLDETGGEVDELLAIARDPKRKEEERGLAVWILGEIGEEGVTGGLKLIIKNVKAPTSVRAAAVVVLARLTTGKLPWEWMNDATPAVAEAAMFALARARPKDAVARLEAVVGEGDRPARQRAMAAELLRVQNVVTSVRLLEEICAATDLDASTRAADLLARHPTSESAQAALLKVFDESTDEQLRALFFEVFAYQQVPGAEKAAWEVLGRETPLSDTRYGPLFRSALKYLVFLHARDLSAPILRLLSEGPGQDRSFALEMSYFLGTVDTTIREKAMEILRSTSSPENERVLALNVLRADESILLEWVDDPSLEISGTARLHLMRQDRTFKRRELCLSTLDHRQESARRMAWRRFGSGDPEEAIQLARTAEIDRFGAGALLDGINAVMVATGSPRVRDMASDLLRRILGQSEDQGIRELAVDYLGILARSGVPSARSALVSLLGEPAEGTDLRIAAATSIATWVERPAEIELLAEYLGEDNVPLAESIALSLASRSSPLPPASVEILRRTAVSETIRSLLSFMPPVEWPRIRESLKSPEVRLRFLAICRMARAGEEISGLKALKADPMPWIRLAALAAGAQRGDPTPVLAVRQALREAIVSGGDRASTLSLERLGAQKIAEPLSPEFATEILTRLDEFARTAEGKDREKHLLVKGIGRKTNRLDALRQFRETDAGTRRAGAIDLSRCGSRADVFLLLGTGSDEDESREFRCSALSSAAALLGRRIVVAEPGRALEELEGWWSERRFALTVPVLPR